MAKRVKFPAGIGAGGGVVDSYLDLWGSVKVVPKELKSLPQQMRAGKPGYAFEIFDDLLNPVYPDVKAGTQGTVEFALAADYRIPSWQEGAGPASRIGTVRFGSTVAYSCTKEGELSFGHPFTQDSVVENRFQVIIQRFQPQPQQATVVAQAVYKGDDRYETSGQMTLPGFSAYFTVTNKVVPPRPPVPILRTLLS